MRRRSSVSAVASWCPPGIAGDLTTPATRHDIRPRSHQAPGRGDGQYGYVEGPMSGPVARASCCSDGRTFRSAVVIVIRIVGTLVLLGLTFWWAVGLAVAGPGGDTARLVLAVVYAAFGLVAMVCVLRGRGSRAALAAYGVALVAVLAWYGSLRPSNDRDWAPELARTPYATVQGDLVTSTTSAISTTARRRTSHPRTTTGPSTCRSSTPSISSPPTGWGPPSPTCS